MEKSLYMYIYLIQIRWWNRSIASSILLFRHVWKYITTVVTYVCLIQRSHLSCDSFWKCVNLATLYIKLMQLTCDNQTNLLSIVTLAVDWHIRSFAFVKTLVFQLDIRYLQICFRRIRRILHVSSETYLYRYSSEQLCNDTCRK